MRDELFGEYKVKTFNRDGSTVYTMDKPGPGDDINNWPDRSWTIDRKINNWLAVAKVCQFHNRSFHKRNCSLMRKYLDEATIQNALNKAIEILEHLGIELESETVRDYFMKRGAPNYFRQAHQHVC